jgi:hypothetical protein
MLSLIALHEDRAATPSGWVPAKPASQAETPAFDSEEALALRPIAARSSCLLFIGQIRND